MLFFAVLIVVFSKPGLTVAQMNEESMFGLDNGEGLGRSSKFPPLFSELEGIMKASTFLWKL